MSGGSGVQTLSHPSRQFPGPPSVAVETPAEWSAVWVPCTLLAARRTSEDPDAEYPKVHQVVQSVRVTR